LSSAAVVLADCSNIAGDLAIMRLGMFTLPLCNCRPRLAQ
jgi:hypothetical protein